MNQTSVLFDVPGPKTRRRFRVFNIVALLVVLGILAWVVVQLLNKGELTSEKWQPFATGSVWLYYILPGLGATLMAAALSIVFACVFAAVFGFGRLSSIKVVSLVSGAVVEFFRAVPVLLMMVFAYQAYSILGVFPIEQVPLAAVVTGLTLYNGSVFAELLRSGVNSLPNGQREAGWAIGLTRSQTLRSILMPQGLLAMLPALVGQLVVVLKDSALGYMVTYPELLRQAERIGSNFGNLIPAMMVVAVIFIALNLGLSWAATKLAGRLRAHTAAVVRLQVPGGMVHATADEPVGPDETIPLTSEEAQLVVPDPARLEIEEEWRRTREEAALEQEARAKKVRKKAKKEAKKKAIAEAQARAEAQAQPEARDETDRPEAPKP